MVKLDSVLCFDIESNMPKKINWGNYDKIMSFVKNDQIVNLVNFVEI
jgi:hypothetical protein